MARARRMSCYNVTAVGRGLPTVNICARGPNAAIHSAALHYYGFKKTRGMGVRDMEMLFDWRVTPVKKK